MRLRIKSFKDVEISIPAGSVVAHLKQQVKAALLDLENDEESQDRYLRLICKGRLLLPDDHPLTDFNVQDGDVVHAVLAPPTKVSNNNTNNDHTRYNRNGNSNNTSSEEAKVSQSHGRTTRRRHLVVGPGGRVTRASQYDESDEEEDDASANQNDTSRRGFDRLRLPENGISIVPLSRGEITALRMYFSRNIDRHMAQQQQQQRGDDDEEAAGGVDDPMMRRYLAEEDWMAHQGPTSEFRLNVGSQNLFLSSHYARRMTRNNGGGTNGGPGMTAPVGTDRDFLWGFMLGSFVGFIMLFWVWIPTGMYMCFSWSCWCW